jgi:hypothetical protein
MVSDMNRQAIEEYFQSVESEALVIDGMDEAIIGVAQQFTNAPLVAYSMSKIINILMEQGMDHEEALEYFEFNIQGAWLGEGTPVIVDDRSTGYD